jgi:DNA excision repair protein ERCC-6
MWELHCQSAGGIIGDEMGLGKTIQVISFLSSLHFSGLLHGPTLIACPATVLQQWVYEFHTWYPRMRVALLHDSGTFHGKKKDLIKKISSVSGVLITTYEGIRTNQDLLSKFEWEYIVLDEGHKIRNPDAEITLACKRFPTPHRLILTGAPIQVCMEEKEKKKKQQNNTTQKIDFTFFFIFKNNLTELWSLFDFVFPGRLGTLPVFQTEFSVPITLGGYANASQFQVQTAYRCAVALRDLITPYLLRRMKKDVLSDLPSKTEQVLFCQLTDVQRQAYLEYLKSEEVQSILDGKRDVLAGIDALRKISNHPDLLKRTSEDRPVDYGNPERSGKLRVIDQLLPLWQQQGHKVLLFAQTRQMLDIVENFIQERKFEYHRMDGTTPIKDRMSIVDSFNTNPNIFIFLLSTKVGGLGLNLVGANRVIIFDPGKPISLALIFFFLLLLDLSLPFFSFSSAMKIGIHPPTFRQENEHGELVNRRTSPFID